MTVGPTWAVRRRPGPDSACVRALVDEPRIWRVCSMGMSADLEVAVEEGATQVRVGSALFGATASASSARAARRGELSSTAGGAQDGCLEDRRWTISGSGPTTHTTTTTSPPSPSRTVRRSRVAQRYDEPVAFARAAGTGTSYEATSRRCARCQAGRASPPRPRAGSGPPPGARAGRLRECSPVRTARARARRARSVPPPAAGDPYTVRPRRFDSGAGGRRQVQRRPAGDHEPRGRRA